MNIKNSKKKNKKRGPFINTMASKQTRVTSKSHYNLGINFLKVLAGFILMILPDFTSTTCPIVQKISTEATCTPGPVVGTEVDLTCTTIAAQDRFTIISWIRYPQNWANYGLGDGGETVLFSLRSKATETVPRLALTYVQGSTGGLQVILGRKPPAGSETTEKFTMIAHTEDQLKYAANTWSMVILSVNYESGINKVQGNYFYLSTSTSPTTAPMVQSTPPAYKAYLGLTPFDQSILFDGTIPADLKMYVGGAGTGGGTYKSGGCFDVASLIFMPGYVPSGIGLLETDASFVDFMYGHFQSRTSTLGGIFNDNWGELGSTGDYVTNRAESLKSDALSEYNGKIFDYGVRVKNVDATNFVNECTVDSDVVTKWKNSDNSYFQGGIQVGVGDFIECVGWQKRWDEGVDGNDNSLAIGRKEGQVQSPTHKEFGKLGDIWLHFKFTLRSFASNLTSNGLETYDIMGFWVSSREGEVNTGEKNRGGVTERLFQKLGVRVNSDLKLEIVIMGKVTTTGITFTEETGYSLTLGFLEVEDGVGIGPMRFRRFVQIYLNENLQETETFISEEDFGPLFDLQNADRTQHFFIGDIISRGFNRFNFVGEFPHPLVTKAGVNTTERAFSTPIVELHDIQAFQNTTVTKIEDLLPSNCILGMSGFKDCLLCKTDYALDTDYQCQLKTDLPSYTVYINDHEIFMECGTGLFYETTLNFCQNCPYGCIECTTLSTCQVVSLGCPSNCAKCTSPGSVCQECDSGYTLDASNNCQKCNKADCEICPSTNLNSCTKCTDGKYFDQASTSCQTCDSNCKTCETKSTNCLTCPDTSYLNLQNSCTTLPDNTFKWKETETIRNCFPTCKTCSSPLYDECTSCLDPYVRVFSLNQVLAGLSTHRCQLNCPDTHYLSDTYSTTVSSLTERFCLPCSNSIANCEICLQYEASNSKLVCQRCNAGYFVSVDTTSGFTNSCLACNSNCATCVDTAEDCLTCNDGYTIEYDSLTGKNKCVSLNLVYATDNLKCEAHKVLYNGQCLDQCPNTTFKRKIGTDDCADCRYNIAGCYSCHNMTALCDNCWSDHKDTSSSTDCFDCIGNTAQCCKTASTGINNNLCPACSVSNCETCYTHSFCLKCASTHIAAADGSCQPIVSDCDLYSFSGDECVGCSGTNLLDGSGACVANCPTGSPRDTNPFWQDSVLKCSTCDSRCSDCSKANSIYSCTSDTDYSNDCVDGTISNGEGSCIECPNRAKCSTYTAGTCTCTACNPTTLKLVSDTCYDDCPEGTFDNVGVCTACAGCKSCYGASETSCSSPVSCLDNYVKLESGGNEGCCSAGQYFNGASCQNCIANCQECTGSAIGDCTLGMPGYYNNGVSMVACNSNFGYCTNAGTDLEYRETCNFHTTAYLTGAGAWTASCGAAVGGTCNYAFTDSVGTHCVECAANNFLDITASPMACVASGGCPSGYSEKVTGYTQFGFQRRAGICLPDVAPCATFNDFYKYGCETCNDGYYLFKSTNYYDYFDSVTTPATWEPKEITLCGKCYSTCKTCSSYSPYACLSCDTTNTKHAVLFEGTCIVTCPSGYWNNAGVCEELTYNKDGKEYVIPGIAAQSFKRCPIEYTYPAAAITGPPAYDANIAWYPQNSTNTCEACDTNCYTCWGPNANNCRQCKEDAFKYANFDGECIACPLPSHPTSSGELYMIDNYTEFSCSRIYGQNYDPSGAYDTKTVATDQVTTTFNFDQSLAGDKICYKTLITFDLKLAGSTTWNNKKVTVDLNGNNIWNYHFNTWDFTNYDGTIVEHEVKYNKLFIDNNNCTTQANTATIHHDVTTFTAGDSFAVKNLRINYFLCPRDCKSCTSSDSCTLCTSGMLFYQRPFDSTNTAYESFCGLPYVELKTDDSSIYETKSFLFKPQSFFVFFKKEMNFTAEVEKYQKYYFPTVTLDRSRTTPVNSRLLATVEDVSDRINLIFRASNLMEVEIKDYSEYDSLTASLTFLYPLLEKSTTAANGYAPYGWAFTTNSPIEAFMSANRLLKTTLKYSTDVIADQSSTFWYILLGILILSIHTSGMNWLTISTFQKLYLLIFINFTQFEDSQNLLANMKYFFFISPTKLTQNMLSDSPYFRKTDYETYIESFTEAEAMDQDFVDFIPPFRLGQFGIRKSFLINMEIVVAVLGAVLAMYLLFFLVRAFIKWKYYYKKSLVNALDKIWNFFTFPFYVRYVTVTIIPIFFFAFGNLTFLHLEDSSASLSFLVMCATCGLYFLIYFLMLLASLLHPYPKDMQSTLKCLSRRRKFAQPLNTFFEPYLKNPDPAKITKKKKDTGLKVMPVNRQIHGLKDDRNIGKEYKIISQSKYDGKEFINNDKIQILKKEDHRGGFGQPKLMPGERLDEEGNIIPYDPENPPIDPNTGKPIKIQVKPKPIKKRVVMSIKKMLELEAAAMKNKKEEDEDSEEEKEQDDDDEKKKDGENADGEDKGDDDNEEDGDDDDDDDDGEEEEDEKSFLSTSSSDTDSDEVKLENIKDFGKILGYAMIKNTHKSERMCNCCYINPCCIKFWNLFYRSAKYYNLINIFHNICIAWMCWNFQDKPELHTLIFASTQFLFTFWLYFARPYKSSLVNTFLLLSETFIELFLIGMYLKSLEIISIPDLNTQELVIEDLYTLKVIQIMAYVFCQTMPSLSFYSVMIGFVLASLKGLVVFAVNMTNRKSYLQVKCFEYFLYISILENNQFQLLLGKTMNNP